MPSRRAGPRGDSIPGNSSQYPLLCVFGREHRFLSREEATRATPEERIRSVWPYIVGHVLKFCDTLHARELVNVDPEDATSEIWIELVLKDDKWLPARGEYINFAASIVHNCLYRLRELSRTVESPRNASCRLRAYRDADEAGTLSVECRKTRGDIDRTITGTTNYGSIQPHVSVTSDSCVVDAASDAEHTEQAEDALADAIGRLSPYEAVVVGQLNGLWGHEPSSIKEVAAATGKTRESVSHARNSAYAKIKDFLQDHPISRSADEYD